MFCEYCNNEFNSRSTLNSHQKKAIYCLVIQGKVKPKEEDIFNCDKCEKILSTKKYLEIHKQTCEGKKENIFKCDFCNKTLSSKRNLDIHTRKCEIIKEKEEFKCEYCEKILSTKQMLGSHKNICSIKKDVELEKTELELKDLKELKEKIDLELIEKEKIIIKIKTQNKNYKEQNLNYKEQIKELQDKLDKIANKAIEKPTNSTTTTHNNLIFNSSIDFNDLDKLNNKIENNLNINHVIDGQKGIANFVKDNILTDDNGDLNYICTDPSRNVFKYKDPSGEVKKDIEAKKLTSYILGSEIRKKSAAIGNEWCKDDNGEVNINRFNIMLEQQKNIVSLSNNNNSFKRELVSLTTN